MRNLCFGALRLFAAAFFVATFMSASAKASDGAWQKSEQAEARLIAATTGVGTSNTLALGVQLNLRDGWKTYWRSPGDAGLPPSLDWTGSENFKSATLSYPAPHRFELLGLQTVGYSHGVIFPLTVDLKEPGKPFTGKAQLNILVCEKLCVPQVFNLEIAVPEGPASPGPEAQALNRFQASVPGDGRAAGLSLQSATAIAMPGAIEALQVVATSRETFQAPDIFPELKSDLSFARPQVTISADGKTATVTIPLSKPLPPGGTLADQAATLTIIDGERSAAFETTIRRGAGAATSASDEVLDLAGIIAVALLGGFILNFMPCVLPILSIKIISFAKETGRSAQDIRRSLLATAAGIITSMLLIAGVLLALKAAGFAIGWGIQFQQPLFVASMALVLTLFACNFWDLFEVSLPGSLSNFAVSSGGDGRSLFSNFLIGAFATLLATPCSAPFVGTAVGFALGQGPVEIFSIFAALGIGLAAPYLGAALVPSAVHLMPRPGVWMVTLRRIMGVALALTALWLISVLAGQVGWRNAALIAGLLVALMVSLAFATSAPRLRMPLVSAATAFAILTLVSGAFVVQSPVANRDVAGDRIAWEPLRQDRIKSLVAQGKTVFVDVTADWCLTCKANKQLVLEQLPLADRLNNETIPMRGDWTAPDPKITEFLGSFGKYGVPFNVVFGPGSPTGIPLPELLTTEAVSAAIDKASVPPPVRQTDSRS